MFYSLFRVTIAHISFTARRAVFMHHYNGFSDSVQCMSLRNFETGLGKLILLNTSWFKFKPHHTPPPPPKKKEKKIIHQMVHPIDYMLMYLFKGVAFEINKNNYLII